MEFNGRGKGDMEIVPTVDHCEQLDFRLLTNTGALDFFKFWKKIKIQPTRTKSSYVIDLGAQTYLYCMKRENLGDEMERVPQIFVRIQKSVKRHVEIVMQLHQRGRHPCEWHDMRDKEILIKLHPLSQSLLDTAEVDHTLWKSHGNAGKNEAYTISDHFASWLHKEVFRIEDEFDEIAFCIRIRLE